MELWESRGTSNVFHAVWPRQAARRTYKQVAGESVAPGAQVHQPACRPLRRHSTTRQFAPTRHTTTTTRYSQQQQPASQPARQGSSRHHQAAPTCPILSPELLPSTTGLKASVRVRGSASCSTAMSLAVSVPTTRAVAVLWSCSVTFTSDAPLTVWAATTT